MFCVYCGKKINDEANFCPYCGAKLKTAVQDNKETTNDKKKKLTIEAVENALLKSQKPEDRILLLKVAGDAYASGDIGALKDSKKAIEKYKEAADLGSAECEHAMGVTYIYEYWGLPGDDAEFNFSLGVMYVCQSYKKGYVPAGDTLQYLIDNGVFPNCNSIQDLLDLSTVV